MYVPFPDPRFVTLEDEEKPSKCGGGCKTGSDVTSKTKAGSCEVIKGGSEGVDSPTRYLCKALTKKF
jgi:hypothetical protein